MTLFAKVVASAAQNFATSYNDKGSSASCDVQFWTAATLPGAVPLRPAGDICEASPSSWIYGSNPPLGQVVLLGGSSGEVLSPMGFSQVWTDSGGGAELNGTIWAMRPPNGYTALGHVITFSTSGTPNVPDTNHYYCVRNDLVTRGQVGAQIWNSQGSGAEVDVGVYGSSSSAPFVNLGTFIAMPGSFGPPNGAPVPVIPLANVTWQ